MTNRELIGRNIIEYWLNLNPLEDYLFALSIMVIGFVALSITRRVILKRLVDSTNPVFNYFIQVEPHIFAILYGLLIFTSFHALEFTMRVNLFARYIFAVLFTFLIIRLFATSIAIAIYSYVSKDDDAGVKRKQVQGIVIVLNAILWVVGLIFLFDNFGFNVTAVLTGLGVGGIAIALAAQTILGDLFNYFVIFFDKPFEVGDFIIVDDKMGTVEYIGLKTTRIKSLGGEQIVFSNSNLTSSRIHNYKRMNERRIVFTFGVVIDTASDLLKAIPPMVRRIIEDCPTTRFDRAHFKSFGEYSLLFEVVYFTLDPDYNIYMDIQQNINIKLYEELENRRIKLAMPSYSVKLHNRDNVL